jgi:hypothetical protein
VVLPKSGAPRFEARNSPARRTVTDIRVRPVAPQNGRQAMNVSMSSLY